MSNTRIDQDVVDLTNDDDKDSTTPTGRTNLQPQHQPVKPRSEYGGQGHSNPTPFDKPIFSKPNPTIVKFDGIIFNYQTWYQDVKQIAEDNSLSYMLGDARQPEGVAQERWMYICIEWVKWLNSTLNDDVLMLMQDDIGTVTSPRQIMEYMRRTYDPRSENNKVTV